MTKLQMVDALAEDLAVEAQVGTSPWSSAALGPPRGGAHWAESLGVLLTIGCDRCWALPARRKSETRSSSSETTNNSSSLSWPTRQVPHPTIHRPMLSRVSAIQPHDPVNQGMLHWLFACLCAFMMAGHRGGDAWSLQLKAAIGKLWESLGKKQVLIKVSPQQQCGEVLWVTVRLSGVGGVDFRPHPVPAICLLTTNRFTIRRAH
jgi:hypothetical protein